MTFNVAAWAVFWLGPTIACGDTVARVIPGTRLNFSSRSASTSSNPSTLATKLTRPPVTRLSRK